MNFLSRQEYEAIVFLGLLDMGIQAEQANLLINSRFPTAGQSLLAECSARGVGLTLPDLEEFLWATVGQRWEDGSTIDPATTLFNASNVESFLAWACENRRGVETLPPTFTAKDSAEVQ